MSPNRISQRYSDFTKALGRLRGVLLEDPLKTDAVIDATIQRFEFSFELAWKLMRDILLYNGTETNNPRSAIKESFKESLIEAGDEWLAMLDDRNKTTHIYDEQDARKIYRKIKDEYFILMEKFEKKAAVFVAKMDKETQGDFLK